MLFILVVCVLLLHVYMIFVPFVKKTKKTGFLLEHPTILSVILILTIIEMEVFSKR